MPRSDLYIEKTSAINEQIDRMRHSATRALLERDDVIIVASVSCIYGIGSPEVYSQMVLNLRKGQRVERAKLLRALVELQYKRNDLDFHRGTFRARGDSIEIFPAHLEDRAWRLSLFGDEIESIVELDPLTGREDRHAGAGQALPQQPLRDAQADARRGGRRDQGRAQGAPRRLSRQGPPARGRAPGAAHHRRPRDDHRHRQLPRDRELFALSDRAAAGRAAADALRVHPRQCAPDRRREPHLGAPARRHVPGRLPAQVDPRRVRLPPAVLRRQPAA